MLNTKKCLLATVLAGLVLSSVPQVYARQVESGGQTHLVLGSSMQDLDQENAELRVTKEGAKKTEIRREVILNRLPLGTDLAGMSNLSHGAQIIRMGDKTVKNAPYSAEVIVESIQRLADGNTLSSKISSNWYRDTQGRTREDIRDAKGEVREVVISDQADRRIILNPRSKTATILATRIHILGKDGNKMPMDIVTENISKSKDGKNVIELKLAESGDKKNERHVLVRRVERDESKVNGDAFKTVTVDVRGPEGAPRIEMFSNGALEPGFARFFGDAKWAAKRQTKSLGSKEIDGIKSEGKVTSYEIPAGEIGNTQAILVSDEVWTSPELQITVYSKHSDPRSGERIYRLNNLKRDDIPAAMFVVPSDYKIRDLGKMTSKGVSLDLNEKGEKEMKIEREIKIEKK
ncbi:hypothetical protein [Undibacterium fentianense]|uniref:Uncharacterized protein n=1 Tax=Undibacterium fentianense TaxID=2828728 RepID=A0A941E0I0_9BURK|nr:hypothetical protein [Undibacterium fentianense]MBR7799101.1 hypothetical protein [Undibacterium fentianense]